MLADQSPPFSLIEREKRKTSVFRPPKYFKAAPPQKKGLTASAMPFYPLGAASRGGGLSAVGEELRETPRPCITPPVALGLSPVQRPRPSERAPPALSQLLPSPSSTGSLFSPLSTPVSTFFHTFSDAATEERMYPSGMFMSVRRDASHTPHGVLKWCVRQYVEVPALKVPAHLRLSMNEVVQSDDGVTRGALGASLKSKLRNKLVRQTHHKVMSVLSRITRAKYNELLEELLQLPLRQSDDAELQEVVKVFFDKAVQEHEYSDLYAQLVRELCAMKESERDLDPLLHDRLLCSRMRTQLMHACEEQFCRPIELTADEKVDRTTGKPLREEEVDMKRTRMKNRLVGNVKFVGELYKMELVTERVIENILYLLVGTYDAKEPDAKEEYVFEVFAMLVKTVAHLFKDHRPRILAHYLGIAKKAELTHSRPRVRFLLMDLADLNVKHQWIPVDRVVRDAGLTREELAKCGGAHGSAQTASKGYNNGKPVSFIDRSTGFGYEDATATNGGVANHTAAHIHQPQQSQLVPPLPHSHSGVYNSTHQSQLTMSTSVSTNDFSISLPRSRSSAASLPISFNANSTSNASANAANTPMTMTTTTATTATAGSGNVGGKQFASNGNGNTSGGQQGTAGRIFSARENAHSDRAQSLGNANNSGSTPMNQPSHAWPMSFTPVDKHSPLTPAISASELSSACTSEGAHTPIVTRQQRATLLGRHPVTPTGSASDLVNLKDVTQQLMELYNDPAQSARVVHCICDMTLKHKVLCLTWWLRLASISTAQFEERQRVAHLLSEILGSDAGVKPEELLAAIVEWLRFDIEKGLYDHCPRMFDNIAHMVLYCHSAAVADVPNIAAVCELLHAGLFNVMLHELTADRGTDQMVTLVKSAHPVAMAMAANFADPAEESAVLRLAVENRFRLLPYFLSVSSATESELPGTPGSACRTPTTPSLRSPLGDSITSTVHYDPLSRCLSFPRVADDPELQLFRKIRSECQDHGGSSTTSSSAATGGPAWRDEAVKLATTPVGNNSVASQVLQMMKVVGALLACTSVTQHSANLITNADADAAVKAVLARHPGTIFEAAAVMELILHFTQTLSGNRADCPRKSTRIKPLRQAVARWCSQEIIHRGPAMALLRAVETEAPSPRVFTTYHNAITNNELHWHSVLTCLS